MVDSNYQEPIFDLERLILLHESSVYLRLDDNSKTVVNEIAASLLQSQRAGEHLSVKPEQMREMVRTRGNLENPPDLIVDLFVDTFEISR